MDEKNEETNEYNEPSIEEFLWDEVDPDKERRKKRRTVFIRFVAGIIAFVFLISVFAPWIPFFNLPAFEFVKTSIRLSQREDIQQYKQAVVSIEGSSKKGTGFNIDSDGYLITNFHVIEDMNPIVVYFSDGQVFNATLVKEYPEIDIAFLDINGENLPVLSLAKNTKWQEGDAVYVVGNPLGFFQIANKGKMIGLKKVTDIDVPVLAITAPVYRGNSGSPVINREGKVVGVVFATSIPSVKKGERPEGFAIPIEEVMTKIP